MDPKITLYALSTCAWCKRTKKFLARKGLDYVCHDVDLLSGEEKATIKKEVARYNPRLSYPTLVIEGDPATVIVGYDEERLEEALGNG